jgi:hypothetical protein
MGDAWALLLTDCTREARMAIKRADVARILGGAKTLPRRVRTIEDLRRAVE